jgi:uncharacterized membrane protein YphA (DoxX/SURF4 family)
MDSVPIATLSLGLGQRAVTFSMLSANKKRSNSRLAHRSADGRCKELSESEGSLDFRFEFLNQSPAARLALLPLRLIVGFGFIQHGVAKLLKGPDAFAAILQAIGVPGPHFMAWLTILTELTGGTAVLLGAFIPLVSFPLAAVLLVAIFTVHLPYGFSSPCLNRRFSRSASNSVRSTLNGKASGRNRLDSRFGTPKRIEGFHERQKREKLFDNALMSGAGLARAAPKDAGPTESQ